MVYLEWQSDYGVKEKAHCFSGISKSSAGPVSPSNVRQVKTVFCPPVHEQAFNLSHLGQNMQTYLHVNEGHG